MIREMERFRSLTVSKEGWICNRGWRCSNISRYRHPNSSIASLSCDEPESKSEPTTELRRRRRKTEIYNLSWNRVTEDRHCGISSTLPIMYERTKRVCKCIQQTALPTNVHSSYIHPNLSFKIRIKATKITIFAKKQHSCRQKSWPSQCFSSAKFLSLSLYLKRK